MRWLSLHGNGKNKYPRNVVVVVVATTKTRRTRMDIDTEVITTCKNGLELTTKRLCKRIEETLDELESNYTEFYWYLWEQDSGNGSS